MVTPMVTDDILPWCVEWGDLHIVAYEPHSTLFRQGDPVRAVFVVFAGAIKTIRQEPNGEQVIVGVRRRGWVLGAAPALLGRPHAVTARTLVACECGYLTLSAFEVLIRTSLTFAQALQRMLARDLCQGLAAIGRLATQKPRERFEAVLADLALTAPMSPSSSILLPPLHIYELGQIAAISREQASRYISALLREGAIGRSAGRLRIPHGSRLLSAQGWSQP